MKKLLPLGTLALSFLALAGCGSVSVVDYNDRLVALQDVCYDAEAEMTDARDQENYGQVRSLYESALATCTQSQTDIASTDAYDGDTTLRDAFDAELQLELVYLQKIGEIITYWDYDELTDEQQVAEDALWEELDAIEEQLSDAYDVSEAAQKAFADKYGYELED
ncbi:MAG: YgdI/YgdR family lipoprotein [Candidatus Peribacteria bacterium]|jgi:hypothetical protein|nr:YgdI/YgdR family lipoprotein [Candidatus Peribacteria bacterium]